MSVNDPEVTPIGAAGNGWMIGPMTPGGPRWMWAEDPPTEVVGLVRSRNVTEVIRTRATSSRMKAAAPTPGEALAGISCVPARVAVRGMNAAWAPLVAVRRRATARSRDRQVLGHGV